MNIVDLLVTIVVVTILVTIILAIVTYVAYKLRLSREPQREDDSGGHQYFVDYRPRGLIEGGGDAPLEQLDRDVEDMEGHAAGA